MIYQQEKVVFSHLILRRMIIHLSLDDTIRFLELNPPQEIIIHFNFDKNEKVSNMNIENIKSYLKLDENIIYNLNDYKKYSKINFQTNILDKTFKFENMISAIDNIGLTHLNWARISLVSLLDFVNNHQSNLINKLQVPELFENSNNLYLGNRSLEQLNVLPINNNKSLFNIISSAKSILGKRFLRNELSNPISNINILNNRYNLIESFIDDNVSENISIYLENINDIEKIIRKMEINIVNPSEISQLFKSLKNMVLILENVKKYKFKDFEESLEDTIEKLDKFINNWNTKFNLEQMEKINFINYFEDDTSFFHKNVYPEVDMIQENIDTCNNFLSELVTALSKFIDDKNYF